MANKHWIVMYNKPVPKTVYHRDCSNPEMSIGEPSNSPYAPVEVPVAPVAVTPTDINAAIQAAIAQALAQLTGAAPVATAPVPAPVAVKKTLDANSQWYEVLEVIMNWALAEKKYLRILLIGPPGTGKSTTAALLAKIPDDNRKTLHQKQAVEELVGMHHIVDGDKGPKTVFQTICIPVAMEKGQPFLFDELDKQSPEVESSNYGFMDDKPHCSLPNGKLLHAKAGYMVLATSNAGVTALPDALLDRIDAVLICSIPHPGALATCGDKVDQDLCLNHFRGLSTATWQWAGKPTVRRLRAFNMLKPVIGELHAAQCAFGSAGREILAARETASKTANGGN